MGNGKGHATIKEWKTSLGNTCGQDLENACMKWERVEGNL